MLAHPSTDRAAWGRRVTDDTPDVGALVDQVTAENRDTVVPAMAAMHRALVDQGVPPIAAAVVVAHYWRPNTDTEAGA